MTDKNTVFPVKKTLNVAGRLIDFSIPKVMGILNLTPDSFYDGGKNNTSLSALKQTEQMLSEGADFIDLGAYSSRPKADNITEEEELSRLLPVLKDVVLAFPEAIISVDTFRSKVAKAAVSEGAHIINDISGGELDRHMFAIVKELNVPYILMHMKGTPQNMLQNAFYADVVYEVFQYFAKKIKILNDLGVKDLIIDPGFGFSKQAEHSFELLKYLEQLQLIGHPVLVGVSRKSMIYKTLGINADQALNGTTVANTVALMKGANILRVHDVKAAVEAIQITARIRS